MINSDIYRLLSSSVPVLLSLYIPMLLVLRFSVFAPQTDEIKPPRLPIPPGFRGIFYSCRNTSYRPTELSLNSLTASGCMLVDARDETTSKR